MVFMIMDSNKSTSRRQGRLPAGRQVSATDAGNPFNSVESYTLGPMGRRAASSLSCISRGNLPATNAV